jgi:protein-L-isoaspartate(D-aspartate) O-methyltransferase
MRGRIKDSVIEAMYRVPRELFVPDHLQFKAYDDTPLPIAHDQTISAPHMVAIMCDQLDLEEGLKILEVGAGSGYHAAVMANLVGPEGHVYSVERIAELAIWARSNLESAGIKNVSVIEGDGSIGLEKYAPYDRISVAASAPAIPESLKQQLKVGGKMILPVGSGYQELLKVERKNGFLTEKKMAVIFVPLIGEQGFKE